MKDPLSLVLKTWGVALAAAALTMAQACPNPPVPTIDGKLPADVCIPSGFTDLTIDFFDDYGWKAFLAMVWPAQSGHRGLPDSSRKVGAAGARVFETYKPLWEVFHQDGSAPVSPDFQQYEAPEHNACKARAGFGDMVLASFSGIHDIGQAGDGELVGPLVAQNGTYVRYLTGYNEIAFRHIESNKWYLRSALPVVPVPRPNTPPMQFPTGSVVVKSAWMDVTGMPERQRSRIYTRMATVQDPVTGQCKQRQMGLIGLHIAQKTASRPQWIWSTFEQVDLVPPGDIGGPGKYLLHDGTATPMPETNPLNLVPLAKPPVPPFNVTRAEKSPIHPKTVETNWEYRKLLEGTVWRNYQLVMTQWPLRPGDQSVPVAASQAGDIFQTFPGEGATSAFANLTMETFNQARPAQGCMSCHNRARLTADFMWSVVMHAYPEKIRLPQETKK
ncbi:MAG TPA: hypothetical protein VNH18_01050 [Bryobacteraceae bacterium]|nr:hypothetical protein [Bryobacteraceae bacterium]